jgi:flagellar hook-length control protein FliK
VARSTGNQTTILASTAASGAGTTATAPTTSSPRADVVQPSPTLPLAVAANSAPAAVATQRQGGAAKAGVTDRVANAPTRPDSSARSTPTATTPSQGSTTTPAATTPVTVVAVAQTGAAPVSTPTSASGLVTTGLPASTGMITGTAANGAAGSSPTAAAAATTTPHGYTQATPDAMAASIVAMYRSGQSSLVLRLDPPGLGSVSVHVAIGSNADVNVLFVPAVAQTAHLLQTGLGDLRQAMATSGLTLGQAQIGGGASGGGTSGGGSNPGTRAGTPSRIAAGTATPAESARPDSVSRGARAIA